MTTKRIRFIESYATDREGFLAGREYDVDYPEAQHLLAAGIAKDVETETPAKAKKGKKHAMDAVATNPE